MKHILICEANLASKNIGAQLSGSLNIIRTKKNVLDFDKDPKVMNEIKDSELVIVASSHKSEAGINTLTCHTPGNWNKADFGGEPKTLCIAPALSLREGLIELQRQKEELGLNDYNVSGETTHHGPTLNIPIIFIEVGSSEKQWKDKQACKAAAEAIETIYKNKPKKVPVAVGFGGGHYMPVFTKRVLDSNIAIGHICPKYAIDAVDEDTILQAFERTIPKPELGILEWKGLNADQRQKISNILDKNKIKWIKDKDIRT